VREKMFNAILIASGHAQAKRYPPDTRYTEVFEAIAKGWGADQPSAAWASPALLYPPEAKAGQPAQPPVGRPKSLL